MIKTASVTRITNKYDLVNWIYSLPWNITPTEVSDILSEAKTKQFIVWSQKYGFTFW